MRSKKIITCSKSNPAGPGNFLEVHFGVVVTLVTVVFK